MTAINPQQPQKPEPYRVTVLHRPRAIVTLIEENQPGPKAREAFQKALANVAIRMMREENEKLAEGNG
jgi:hypothetical protein